MPHMFLNGGGMRGGSLHHLLRGAPLVAEISTAPIYRLYSVGGRFPALALASGEPGARIAGEMYDLPLDLLCDDLLPAEPPELELSVVKLADGTAALGMTLRRPCPPLDDLTDITRYRGWRAYLGRVLTPVHRPLVIGSAVQGCRLQLRVGADFGFGEALGDPLAAGEQRGLVRVVR
jgi:hypothetical protein